MNNTVNNQKITLFNLFISAFTLLLHRLSQQDTICLGTVVAGRDHPHTSNMLGVFINTLPFIIRFNPNETVAELLSQTSINLMNMLNNQDVSLETLLSNLKIKKEY